GGEVRPPRRPGLRRGGGGARRDRPVPGAPALSAAPSTSPGHPGQGVARGPRPPERPRRRLRRVAGGGAGLPGRPVRHGVSLTPSGPQTSRGTSSNLTVSTTPRSVILSSGITERARHDIAINGDWRGPPRSRP